MTTLRRSSHSLRSSMYAAVVLAVVLAGCRGVLGIHDLDVASGDEGGTDATVDGLADTGAITDAGDADAHPPAAIDAGCQGVSGSACGMCCHEAAELKQAFTNLENYAKQKSCVCGAAKCTTECNGTSVCGTGGQPSPMCGGCVDQEVRAGSDPGCGEAKAACMQDPACNEALLCFNSCNP